jgi:hypothetical protein
MTEQKPPPVVGAKAKIDRAAFLRAQGYFGNVNTKQKKKTPRSVVIVLIYAFCFVYAFLMREDIMNQFPVLSPISQLAGSNEMIVTIILSLGILAASGFVPLCASIWAHLIQDPDANPYLTVWGVTAVLLIVSYAAPYGLEAVKNLMGVFVHG